MPTNLSDCKVHFIHGNSYLTAKCAAACKKNANIVHKRKKQRGSEFFLLFCLLLQDFNRYSTKQEIFTDIFKKRKEKKISINVYSFNQYTSRRLINSMSWHQYVQSETFINRDTFFRARRPRFELQCRLVEAAAVIWTAETIWVHSIESILLQSIYLQF